LLRRLGTVIVIICVVVVAYFLVAPLVRGGQEAEIATATSVSFEGVIARSSGDTNPFIGTPWISVNCEGYVGKPIIIADIDILALFETLKKAGLEPGQNIEYRGQEKFPAGSPVRILIEWSEKGESRIVDLSKVIVDKKTGKPLSTIKNPFVFLGSAPSPSGPVTLKAESVGCIACTVNCDYALFTANKDNSGYVGEYGTASRYYIPEGKLPETGTRVRVIISWESSTSKP